LNGIKVGSEQIRFKSNLKEAKADKNNLTLEFQQVPTDIEKAMKWCMIKGEFTIYTDENVKD
jgi:hypothetical protein